LISYTLLLDPPPQFERPLKRLWLERHLLWTTEILHHVSLSPSQVKSPKKCKFVTFLFTNYGVLAAHQLC